MASAHDVAKYLLKEHGPMVAMRLHKLLYYCQAWTAVWDERRLFDERIEAWANGPVVPDIYQLHRGEFLVSQWKRGDTRHLDSEVKDSIKAVVKFYSKYDAQQLSQLTHREEPWKLARVGLADGDRGDREITLASMVEYYSSL